MEQKKTPTKDDELMNKALKVSTLCLFVVIALYIGLSLLIKDTITIYPKMQGLAYTDGIDDRQRANAHLLNDGDYLLSIAKTSSDSYLVIVKTDSNGSCRRYYLNISFYQADDRLSFAKNSQYIEIQPFQSDYIENDISTEKTDPTAIGGMKNYYFLHVKNGHGIVFQRPLNIPYTANGTELLVKIHAAALEAGYITE